MLLKIHCYLIFLKDKYAQDNGICKILYCSIVKKKKKKNTQGHVVRCYC